MMEEASLASLLRSTASGAIVHGLHLEGARWDEEQGLLDEAR